MNELEELEEVGLQYKIDVICANCNQLVQISPVSRFVKNRTCPKCSMPFYVGGLYFTSTTIEDVEYTQKAIVFFLKNRHQLRYIDPEEKLKIPYSFKINIDIWWCLILTAFAGFVIYTIWGKP